jgi:hypothetical protein
VRDVGEGTREEETMMLRPAGEEIDTIFIACGGEIGELLPPYRY